MRADRFADRDVVADFDTIKAAKRNPRKRRLGRLRRFVAARYAQYWEARGALETLAQLRWSEKSVEALRHCYGSASEARDTILKAIEEVLIPDPLLCPYCLMRHPKSLDHFLPQDAFPEFSVLSWNLVLVCDPCNRRKSNRLHGGTRSILNPYFDAIPGGALLHAEIGLSGGRMKLSYRVTCDDPEVPPELVALAKRHVDKLRLSKDLVREGTTYISTILNSIAAEHVAPIDARRLDEILDARMRGLADFPVNSWQVAVVDAMEQCAGLLGMVNARIAAAPRPERVRPKRDLTALRAAADALGRG